MRIKLSIVAVAVLTACVAVADPPTEYKLPDGRILKNPIVLEKTPDGLSIGHAAGIVFVKFANLPADVQKRYNYDPVQAKQYEKARKAAQLSRVAREEAAVKSRQEARKQADIRAVEIEIAKLELRIKFLTEEIPSLEKESAACLNGITAVDSAPRYNGGVYWRGGFMNMAAEHREARERLGTMAELSDRRDEIKTQLTAYKIEKQQKEIQLIQLKHRYRDLTTNAR